MSKCGLAFAQTALDDLDRIHSDSVIRWGEKTADTYIADVHKVIKTIPLKPELGELRLGRSSPFSMVPARQHFIVYYFQKKRIVIVGVLHQRRHIEKVIADMEDKFFEAIQSLQPKTSGRRKK